MNDLQRPGERRSGADRLVEATTGRLLRNSLILYLAAFAAHRAWLLLNSDVGQLLRKLH